MNWYMSYSYHRKKKKNGKKRGLKIDMDNFVLAAKPLYTDVKHFINITI